MHRSKSRKKSRKKRPLINRITNLIIFALIITLAVTIAVTIDKKIFPTVLAFADLQAGNTVNDVIYKSISTAVEETGITSSDFYVISSNEDGFVNSMAVNTLLVNEICGKIGRDVSNALVSPGRQKIKVPIGMLLGLGILANTGPDYTVTLIPMGEAIVNYETLFEAVGINQVNFQVWVYVDTKIQIVNPIQKATTTISRKISLVNTVFGGKVPDSFFNNAPISVPVK